MFRKSALSIILALLAVAPARAAPRVYTLDPTHSQVTISWDHMGLSTTSGLVPGLRGELLLDREVPATARISVSVPVAGLFTGDDERDFYILGSGNFLDPEAFPEARFQSTSVEVTSPREALVTGDLTLNGITRPVVLQARFNGGVADYPFPPFNGRATVGFDASMRIKRSDFGMGLFAPLVGDEVTLRISIEAMDLN